MNTENKELEQRLAQSKKDLKCAFSKLGKPELDRILANHKVPYMQGKGVKIHKNKRKQK
ncbi:hypothetical protein [Winogradskyella sp.]|uniref:hypothetical protein n=1 Tax=Winogradskyella sp. TaxID=1883156 RepID=UPI003BAC3DA5